MDLDTSAHVLMCDGIIHLSDYILFTFAKSAFLLDLKKFPNKNLCFKFKSRLFQILNSKIYIIGARMKKIFPSP